MPVQRVLTGITTSGSPHLGNYAGAIRPAIAASRQADVESFYFLADYHALIHSADPASVQRSTLEVAAVWLAAGLDTERVHFYRQSDIPEVLELAWLMRAAFAAGIAWGEAKQVVLERIEAALAPTRGRYQSLMANPEQIEQQLREGAAKARAIATPFLDELRRAVGLRGVATSARAARS